jgi:hypothetical protein
MDLNHLFSADETDEHNHCSAMQFYAECKLFSSRPKAGMIIKKYAK